MGKERKYDNYTYIKFRIFLTVIINLIINVFPIDTLVVISTLLV